MRVYDKNEPLISIHIPKSGGTSFQDVVKDWFQNKCIYNYPKKEVLPPQYDLHGGYCLHGHFNRKLNFGIEKYYSFIKQFITFMRDPVSLHESMYFYKHKLHSRGNTAWDWKIKGIPSSLDEFFEEYEPTILYHLPKDINIGNYQEIFHERFIHIGIVEKYSQSLKTLASKLDKKIVPLPHKNRTEKDEKPSSSAKNQFIDKHPLIFAMYEFAQDLNH